MRILWDNKIKNATVLSFGAHPDYPVENVQDSSLAKIYKTLEVDVQYIDVSGGAITADYFAVFNHNFTDGAKLSLKGGNDVVDWGNPDYKESVPFSDYYLILNAGGRTYDQWRFEFDDPDNAEGFVKIGMMFLGEYLQMPGMAIDQELPLETTAKQTISYSGQVYGDDGYDFKNGVFNFPLLNETQRTNIKTMFKSVKHIKPIILLVWANDLDLEPPMYCVIDQKRISFKRTKSYNDKWKTKIKFREVF